jgi:putative endonuclease
MKSYFVYILSSKKKILYVGMTSNLERRIYEHKSRLIEGFTKEYNVDKLVYYEFHTDKNSAEKREQNIKNWHREWKINLIEAKNKEWKDLYYEIADPCKLLWSNLDE